MSKIKNILKRIGLSERDAEDLINEIRSGKDNDNTGNDGSNDNANINNTKIDIDVRGKDAYVTEIISNINYHYTEYIKNYEDNLYYDLSCIRFLRRINSLSLISQNTAVYFPSPIMYKSNDDYYILFGNKENVYLEIQLKKFRINTENNYSYKLYNLD